MHAPSSNSVLLIVDVQEKLAPGIAESGRVVFNVRRLLDAAKAMGVRVIVSEQYPKGLGPTIPEIAAAIPENALRVEKKSFSVVPRLESFVERNIVLCGMETHICVQQTALDLLQLGKTVFLAVDACGSRFPADADIALRRMEQVGIVPTTTESLMFEWCETAEHPMFKTISNLAKEKLPSFRP